MNNIFTNQQNDSLSILLIEDNPDDVVLIEELLVSNSSMVFQLFHADCLATGLHQLNTESIDLVLLDLALPDSKGLETLDKVLGVTRNVPVVVLTGLNDETIGLQAVKHGAQDYLSKSMLQEHTLRCTIRYSVERQRTEKALLNNKILMQDILDCNPSLVYIVDIDGHFLFANRPIEILFNVNNEMIIGHERETFMPEEIANQHRQNDLQVILEDKTINFEEENIELDGKHFYSTIKFPLRDTQGRIYAIGGMSTDITAKKQVEKYREMEWEIMSILNESVNMQDSIQHILGILKTRTGLDVVGIRLQDGDDFPYIVQQGFSEDFLIKENSLIERSMDGGVCHDKDGNINLECTCGMVISNKTDSNNPYLTRGGSFWTNDSFPLLDLPADQDLRLHPRNECIHQGYSSVALVPIKTKNKIIGLIHLNDRHKGCFTLDMIERLEIIASRFGNAFERKQAEE
ncbi:MAG: response regulator [bacterium]